MMEGSAVSLLERSHVAHVSVPELTHIVEAKGEHCLRSAGGGDEFDFHSVRAVEFDNRAYITAAQLRARYVVSQRNGVEQLVHGWPRECVKRVSELDAQACSSRRTSG